MNSSVNRLLLAVLAVAFVLSITPATAASAAGGQAKVDLNTASQADLEKLPGIDAAAARQIIAARPYKSVADLSKSGLPESTIEKISPLVKVGILGRAAAATKKGVTKGADATAKGIGKGADATARGVEKGVGAGSKGVQKGAEATGGAAGKVGEKVAGTPRKPPMAGMVWADTDSKLYYAEGDPLYGNTRDGKWLTKEEAVKQGYRPAKQEPPKK